MAQYTLSNKAMVSGTLNDKPLAMDSLAVATWVVDELSIVKTADKETWATGNLTYTITITNGSSYPYSNVEVTDTLDTRHIALVADSIYINDTLAVVNTDYTLQGNLLTIKVPTIAENGNAVITFQVSKA